MRTVIYVPPLPRMSGGIAVLYQLADSLRATGRDCVFVSSGDTAPGLEAAVGNGFERLVWSPEGAFLSPDDIYLVPEGWPNALAPGFAAKCRCAVYVQNWAYLLSGLPAGVSWSKLPVRFVAVSQPVAWFLKEVTNLPVAGIVRPALPEGAFVPGRRNAKTIRIGWMPRKNRALAEQIRQIAEAALEKTQERDHIPPLEWVELHRMSPEQVAAGMGGCHIFLCTGFPEGFALPPLEAMASGCLTVGFSGFGGWDYMREARSAGQSQPYPPVLPLRETLWGGNGFFAMDGDVVSAALALKEAAILIAKNDPFAEGVIRAARITGGSYTAAAQREEADVVWNILES